MRPPQGFEWLLILFIILLLFGAKRLPDMARGLGRSLRILKAETRGMADDDSAEAKLAAPDATAADALSAEAEAADSQAPSAEAPRAAGGSTGN